MINLNDISSGGLKNAIDELGNNRRERGSRLTLFPRQFRMLGTDERKELCRLSTELLKQRFNEGQSPDDILLVLTHGLASERDWDSSSAFLDSLLKTITASESLRDVVISLLDIADNELTEERGRIPVGQTALVLLTELGFLLANRSGGSGLDYRGTSSVVEYITSSLLARSNVNDNAMRIALIHYLARCPMNQSTTQQLNRVISRFGQSLLDDLLKAYFEDKKRGNAAFHFLLQYLNVFLVQSPSLAEMSHDVLKHYMLKHPDDFPAFLSSYCERIPREEARLAATTRHVALLMRAAIEISKRPLAEAIAGILVNHVAIFRDISPEHLEAQVQLARQIARSSLAKASSVAVPLVALFEQMTQELLDDTSGTNSKVIPIGRGKKIRKPKATPRSSRIGAEPSPLETMLSLAS